MSNGSIVNVLGQAGSLPFFLNFPVCRIISSWLERLTVNGIKNSRKNHYENTWNKGNYSFNMV
jgi:hypothetical protein